MLSESRRLGEQIHTLQSQINALPDGKLICSFDGKYYKWYVSNGHLLRSKSESIIDTFLYLNKIPFRYECALCLKESTIFPDFTIRHPKTGQTYYWEHFGLMDNPNYYKNAYSKLQFYTSCGIVPSIQLIATFETKNHPLNSELVEKIVTHYFL